MKRDFILLRRWEEGKKMGKKEEIKLSKEEKEFFYKGYIINKRGEEKIKINSIDASTVIVVILWILVVISSILAII